MAGLMVFRSLADALRAGFQIYDRTPDGYLVRTRTATGWAMAIVEYLLARPEARIWFEDRRPHLGAETKRRNAKRRRARATGKVDES